MLQLILLLAQGQLDVKHADCLRGGSGRDGQLAITLAKNMSDTITFSFVAMRANMFICLNQCNQHNPNSK